MRQPAPDYRSSLNVEVRDAQGILLDEFAPWFDDIAHEAGEDLVGDVGLCDLDPKERAIGAVQRGLPQLLGVHFAQALVALDAEPLAACREHCVEELGWPADGDSLAL